MTRSITLPSRNQLKDGVARVITRVHIELYRRTGGKLGGRFKKVETLLLTTTGRRSGQPRTTPLLYVRDGDRFVVVASYGGDDRDPQWFKNLQANPDATIQVGPETMRVRAAAATAEEKQRLWPRVLEVYNPYAAYQRRTSRDIPLAILTPSPG